MLLLLVRGALPSVSDDEEMVPEDPLFIHDPWAPPPRLAQRALGSEGPKAHAKWEHLTLPTDHAFRLADSEVVPVLVPRELGPLWLGLLPCQCSWELMGTSPPGPSAFVVPGQSKASLVTLMWMDLSRSWSLILLLLLPTRGVAGASCPRHCVPPGGERCHHFVELVVECFEGLLSDFPALLSQSLTELCASLDQGVAPVCQALASSLSGTFCSRH